MLVPFLMASSLALTEEVCAPEGRALQDFLIRICRPYVV